MKDVSILTNAGIDVNKSLELFGDMETYDQMLEDFLKEVDTKIENATMYLNQRDMANYAIIVHSLKSDVRYFGITALGDEFYEHELAGKRNDYFFVKNNFDKLLADTNKMVNVLKRYMGILVGDEENNSVNVIESNGNKTILVVDDSNIIRNFVQKIFEGKYNVKACNDGGEAISFVSNMPTDEIACMLLDLNMPNVDGFQVLDYLKNANLFNKIPVSIITGNADKEAVDRAFTYPIIDIIQKPFNEESIKTVALKTISQKKM